MLLEAQKLSEEGETVFIDTYYDKLLYYYIDKYCMRWLISPSDRYFPAMKQIAEIDKDVLPDADVVVFFEINHHDWLEFLKARSRPTDQDEDFMKNFETQKFLLEATQKLCAEKGIELIIFPQDNSSIKDSALNLKSLLEDKLAMGEDCLSALRREVKEETNLEIITINNLLIKWFNVSIYQVEARGEPKVMEPNKWPSGKAPGLGPGDLRRLEPRGISEEQLLVIKEKLIRQKELIAKVNNLRSKRNQLSQEGQKNAEQVKKIKEGIALYEKELNDLEKELNELTSQLPNLPALDTPTNKEGNRIIDKTEYQHDIKHELTHEAILKKLAIIDEEKSLLLSGSKFAVYQGFGSHLLHALINFMRFENSKRGYRLFDTPYLVQAGNLYNTGQFHKFQDNLYKLEENNFYLLPTAEVSLVNLYQKQILTEGDLPLNLCAYSPCFRAERMAAGQENKGLIRLHQFHKVELVKIVKPENSYAELEKLLADARHILHLLKIPHRVIELCHKELGFTAAKTYDIEV
ncbi:11271_t:CDS:2 [Entrophospora sp. SA101]|nr:12688_t:CDS:2 [Entrophospora sp. SA101]CAJ0869219.1 11271_t:CDS:2 [Entrophospora sp. SA101]CAJ0914592.1 1310_t:CDS:2 [Entrophospora sp. SA101]